MEMLTLDRFIELQGIEKVDYIRMDVEGYEVEIAKGMTETLERFSPQVLMELHYVHFNDERILDKMVLDILSKGYEIGKLSNRKRAVPVSSLWDKEVRKACPHVLFKKRGRKIKILGALPELIRGAGAHRANLLLLDALVERGFDVKVYATRKAWDGLKIDFIFTRERKRVAELFDWADVIFTQGKEIPKIRSLIGRKPVIYYAHNNYRINTIHSFYEISEQDIDLLIFNAKWVLETTPWRNDSIVVNPPVFAEQFKTKPGDHITLVNIGVQKGGETFFELARRFPEKKFLGVKSWGKQFIPKEIPDNVTLISPTNNMRDDVYSKTKVLLMPSQYSGPTELWQWTESWGMVGVEAMSSGIPVIAHPAPGLLESLDYAGIFIDRKDYNGWEEAIRKLDDPDVYRRQSELSLKRVTELDPNPQIDALAEMIKRKLGYWKCYR
jgi:glycosyltransferase involved in cell wall biosynthesis